MSSKAATIRDPRLDFFRGSALLTIFINHVPGNPLEAFTSKNFGFSDAAEAFVFMSGLAAALAYYGRIASSLQDGVRKIASRSAKLYWTHLTSTLAAVSVVAMLAAVLGDPTILDMNNMSLFFSDPVHAAIGLVTLGHQIGYFNILPLYVVLLAASPLMIMASAKSPALLLIPSVGTWAIAGTYKINLPNYPADGSWFLDPFCWQLAFAVGIAVGVEIKKGRALVPFNPWIMTAAACYLTFSCVVVVSGRWDIVAFPSQLDLLVGFDKGYLQAPRLLHVLSLVYLLAYLPGVHRLAAARVAAPLRELGKNSLAVFATGSVVCIALQAYRQAVPTDAIEDALLLTLGLLPQIAAARWDWLASHVIASVPSITPVSSR